MSKKIEMLFNFLAANIAPENSIRAYRGRGGVGKDCFAIVGDKNEINSFPIEMLKMAHADEVAVHYFYEIADMLLGSKTDNMGRDYVLYFPKISFASDEELIKFQKEHLLNMCAEEDEEDEESKSEQSKQSKQSESGDIDSSPDAIMKQLGINV